MDNWLTDSHVGRGTAVGLDFDLEPVELELKSVVTWRVPLG